MPHISFRMGSMGLFDLDSLFVFLLNELLPQINSSDLHVKKPDNAACYCRYACYCTLAVHGDEWPNLVWLFL